MGVDESTAFAGAFTQRLCTFYFLPIWGSSRSAGSFATATSAAAQAAAAEPGGGDGDPEPHERDAGEERVLGTRPAGLHGVDVMFGSAGLGPRPFSDVSPRLPPREDIRANTPQTGYDAWLSGWSSEAKNSSAVLVFAY
jgi:hypothetical protein